MSLESNRNPSQFLGEQQAIAEVYGNQYSQFLEQCATSGYDFVVTDLDGVVLDKNVPQANAVESVVRATLLHSRGRKSLGMASGRTLEEIMDEQKGIVPYINTILQREEAPPLEFGEFVIFPCNASQGIDIATGHILYDLPLQQEALDKIKDYEEIQVLRDLSIMQQQLTGENRVGRAKIIDDNKYTYTIGFKPESFPLIEDTEAGKKAVALYIATYGIHDNLIPVANKLNSILQKKKIPLSVTTSGALIDINAQGVSKGLAEEKMQYVTAERLQREPHLINGIGFGDCPEGNDKPITHSKPGFIGVTNVPYPKTKIQAGTDIIYIVEAGNQFDKIATCLNKLAQ